MAPTSRRLQEESGIAPASHQCPSHRIGRRFLVTPADLPEPPTTPEQILLRIDPGAAFGDGAHPTTQLCLAAVERQVQEIGRLGDWRLGTPGPALIDLGAGTGILAIAAAKLGAQPILAVDIDPAAVRVARANVALNQVAGQVRVEQGSLAEVLAARYGLARAPLVVANILAHVLVDFFAHGLADAVTPDGLLILSGILRTQGPELRARLGWHGLTLVAEEKKDDWLCVIARRDDVGTQRDA
jgi:ribosomal protein L11 methyltransferase